MAIRLLATYGGFPPQSIITLGASTDAALVSQGYASADLTGGVVAYREVPFSGLAPSPQRVGTIHLDSNSHSRIPLDEGVQAVITAGAGATGTIQRYDDTGAAAGGPIPITAGTLPVIGAYRGTQTLDIRCNSGPVDIVLQDAVLSSVATSAVLSSACKFFYPWVRDASSNVVNKGPNAGDAVKTGTSVAAQVGGYFNSVAGTYGAGGTGRYYLAPTNSSHFSPATETLILHIGFNKAAPGGSENFAGTQINSSTSGVLLTAGSSGSLTVNYKPGTVQNVFTAITGLVDGTDHSITLVIDRLTKTAWLYADSILRQTKTGMDFTGTPSALTNFVFGGYSGIPIAYDAKFFNCHLYAVPKDAADINVQACVDKLTILKQALTVTDLGV